MFGLILYCYFYFSFKNFNYGDKIIIVVVKFKDMFLLFLGQLGL